MPAGLHKFYCDQGSTFERTLTITGLDLTGRTVRGFVWEAKNGTKLKDFTATVIDAVTGKFKIALTAAETAALPIVAPYASQNITEHQYIIEIVNSDLTVTPWLKGEFQLSPKGKTS